MNYADLKFLVGQDLNRDDLSDVIDDYIEDRIRHYQRDFLYGSPTSTTVTTTAGVNLYQLPTTLVSVEQMRLQDGGIWRLLCEVEYTDLLAWDTNVPSTQSIPTRWAPYGTNFRVWPTPDAAYTIEITGQGKIAVPADDTTENFWTDDAAMLIRYATTAQIRLLRLRDPEGYQTDMVAAERERLKLVQETAMKQSNDRIKAWW